MIPAVSSFHFFPPSSLYSNHLFSLSPDVFTSLTSLKTLDFPSHFIVLRPFHHLPVFYLYSNSLTFLPSGVFDHLTSLLTLYPIPPSHFLLTPISYSIIIGQHPYCLSPIWTVLKSQKTQISLLPIHQSPLSMMFISPFINQFSLSFT